MVVVVEAAWAGLIVSRLFPEIHIPLLWGLVVLVLAAQTNKRGLLEEIRTLTLLELLLGMAQVKLAELAAGCLVMGILAAVGILAAAAVAAVALILAGLRLDQVLEVMLVMVEMALVLYRIMVMAAALVLVTITPQLMVLALVEELVLTGKD
jgi:hypothetical protein